MRWGYGELWTFLLAGGVLNMAKAMTEAAQYESVS